MKENVLIENIINDALKTEEADSLMTRAMKAVDELDFTRARAYLKNCLSISDSIEQRALSLSLLFLIKNGHSADAHHILQKAYE